MIVTDYKAWNGFLKNYPEAHILQTSEWGMLKSGFGWRVSHVITNHTGAQILFARLPLGYTWGYIAKGPLGEWDDQFWSLINSECKRNRAIFLKVEPDLLSTQTEATHWLNNPRIKPSPHSVQPKRTIIVDLGIPEEEILGRMKQKTRYNIRLSKRKGVEVSISNDVPRFYQLLESTGERESFGIHTKEYYQEAFDLFSKHESCALVFGEYKSKLLSAVMVFRRGDRSWYFYGASSREHRNLMAPYAAQWGAMRWAKSKGCKYYDLWGVPDEDIDTLENEFLSRNDGLWGVYRFKRGFGGNVNRSVGAYDLVINPVLYQFYRIWMKRRGF